MESSGRTLPALGVFVHLHVIRPGKTTRPAGEEDRVAPSISTNRGTPGRIWVSTTAQLPGRHRRAYREGSAPHGPAHIDNDTVPFEVRRLRAQENGPRNAQGTRSLTRLPRIMLLPARRNTAHDRARLVSAHSPWGILAEQSTIGGDGWES